MFGRIGIHQKLIIGFVAGCIIPMIMILMIITLQSRRNVTLQTFSHLETIREFKKTQIENYFKDMSDRLRILKADPFVESVCKQSDDTPEITNDSLADQRFKAILIYNQWDKILVINSEHKSLFVSTQTGETKKITEKIQDSHIKILAGIQKDEEIVFSDISPAPDSGEPLLLMAGSVIASSQRVEPTDKNESIGYVMVWLSLKRINEIMHQQTGLGKTGRAYLVGQDGLRRSDDYSDTINGSVKAGFANPAKSMVNNHACNEALAGKTGVHFTSENKKKRKSLFSAYTPVNLGNLIYALIVEISGKEALLPLQRTMYMTITVALCAIIISIVIAFFLARVIKAQLDFQNELASLPRKEQIMRMETQMCEASEKLEFEKAAYYRDKIRLLKQGRLM